MLRAHRLDVRNFKPLLIVLFGVIFIGSFLLPAHNIIKRSVRESKSNMKIQVHLDLKGAPPKIEYYPAFFQMLADLKVDAVLMEYEDTFPYGGELAQLRAPNAYTVEDIQTINNLSAKHNIRLIPLVQTFGHLEFVLKYSQFSHLSENTVYFDTICPSDPNSLILIEEMISQIRALHPTNEIHLGSDEAYHVAEDRRCHEALKRKFNESVDSLKLSHISNVAHLAQKHNFTKIYVWNDMFDGMKSEKLLTFKLDQLVVPVIWGYIPDVTREGYFPPGMFDEFSKVFPDMVFGSAFKGANGINSTFMEIKRYVQNLQSYHDLEEMFSKQLKGRVNEIVLTGWQRYKHDAQLCELLSVGIPTLVEQIFYIRDWESKTPAIDIKGVETALQCNSTQIEDIPFKDTVFHVPYEWRYLNCTFPGVELYRAIEELRFVSWKAAIDPEHNETLSLEPKLRTELSKIYHQDTVNEWINQNLYARSDRMAL